MGKTNIEDKLKRVLNFITAYTEEYGFPPSVREIGSALSIKSTATTYYYIEKLQEQGYISKTKAKNRALGVVGKNRISFKSVPLVGKITAGTPITAIENIEEYIPIPSNMFKSNDLFMLSVSGESMIDAGILDGDVIIVNRQNYAENGDIVVALIDNEATVKRFYKKDGYYVLHPENKNMQDIIVKELMILGVVNGLLRKY
jgi:repressor LexA